MEKIQKWCIKRWISNAIFLRHWQTRAQVWRCNPTGQLFRIKTEKMFLLCSSEMCVWNFWSILVLDWSRGITQIYTHRYTSKYKEPITRTWFLNQNYFLHTVKWKARQTRLYAEIRMIFRFSKVIGHLAHFHTKNFIYDCRCLFFLVKSGNDIHAVWMNVLSKRLMATGTRGTC